MKQTEDSWKNHTQAQQPGTFSSCWSPAWSHNAVGWHLILQPAFPPSQPLWLCWSLWQEQQILQMFIRVEVRSADKPFLPLHSQILEVVFDKPLSVW